MSDYYECDALWEPDARPRETHDCDRRPGHKPPHRCSLCRSLWWHPGGTVYGTHEQMRDSGGIPLIPDEVTEPT